MSNELFDQAVAITEEYLGPAAPRFMARQVSFHLDKAPSELVAADIPRLVEWSKATLALLTSDESIVKEFVSKLSALKESHEPARPDRRR